MGVLEQQLGEKPPCTSTSSEEEDPRPAVPHIQASWAGPEFFLIIFMIRTWKSIIVIIHKDTNGKIIFNKDF